MTAPIRPDTTTPPKKKKGLGARIIESVERVNAGKRKAIESVAGPFRGDTVRERNAPRRHLVKQTRVRLPLTEQTEQERANAAADRAKRAALRPVKVPADVTAAKPKGRQRAGDGVAEIARLQGAANDAEITARRGRPYRQWTADELLGKKQPAAEPKPKATPSVVRRVARSFMDAATERAERQLQGRSLPDAKKQP